MIDKIDELIRHARHDYKVISDMLENYNLNGAEELLADLSFMIERLEQLKVEAEQINKTARDVVIDIEEHKPQLQKISNTVE